MITLRTALEGDKEIEIQFDLPVELADGFEFELGPVAAAMESHRPLQRRRPVRSAVAMESIHPALFLAGVVAIMAAIAKMISWFVGSGSSTGSGGGGGGAIGRSEQRLPKIEINLQRSEAGGEIRKKAKSTLRPILLSKKPKDECPDIVSKDDHDFAVDRGPCSEFERAMSKHKEYIKEVKGLVGSAGTFMSIWGTVSRQRTVPESEVVALRSYIDYFKEAFPKMDKIEGRESLVDDIRDLKMKLNWAQSELLKPNEHEFTVLMASIRMRSKEFVDEYRKDLPNLKGTLWELEQASTKHAENQQAFINNRRVAEKGEGGEQDPEVQRLINEGRSMMNRVGNYVHAVLTILRVGIERVERIDKVLEIDDRDNKAFNKWYVSLKELDDSGSDDVRQLIKDFNKVGK